VERLVVGDAHVARREERNLLSLDDT